MTATDAVTKSDGVEIAYTVEGQGDPPIVFVHGWSCDRTFFAPQIEHFGERHKVAALDLRGHGLSEAVEADIYTVEQLADDVAAVISATDMDRPVVIGHSLGALVALAVGARPGMAGGVVMVDPASFPDDEVKAFFRDAVGRIRSDHDGSWRRAFVESMFLPSDRVLRREIIMAVGRQPIGPAAAALASIAEFDVEVVRRVGVPVLAIGAAHPSTAVTTLREFCPGASIGQTVGAGHFNQLEVPDQVNAMIARWLDVALAGDG
jgi:pimeloyl-ACP methyl ester carboxylesterase